MSDLTLTVPVYVNLDPGGPVLVKSSTNQLGLGPLRVVSGDERLFSFRLHQTVEGSTWQRVGLPSGWTMVLSGKRAPGGETAYFTNSSWTATGSGTTLAYTATLDWAVSDSVWANAPDGVVPFRMDLEIRDSANTVRGTVQFDLELSRENYGSGDTPDDPDSPFLDRTAADNIYLSFAASQALTDPNKLQVWQNIGGNSFTLGLVSAADAAAFRTAIGAGTSSFNAASPGTIGGTTPGAATFTTLTASGETTLSGSLTFSNKLLTAPDAAGKLLTTAGGEMPSGGNLFVVAGPDSGLADFDPRVIGFDQDRGSLFGGRLNNGLNAGGELQHGVWDADLVSQYSVTWGWSQVSIGESIGSAGAKTKGSMQIGYGCANAAQFASLSGLANVTLGPGCAAVGTANISGSSTKSNDPVDVTYHDNYATGPVAVLKVAGDLTAEFPVGEHLILGGFAAVADGDLTTRTSDTAGVFTLSTGAAGTALDVNATLTVKWNGGSNGRTLVISASSAVSNTYTVTASGGSGDVLPTAGTKVWIAGAANIGTPRLVYAKPTAVSHSGGVTTITLDRQFAVTFDIARAAPELPWVMNVGDLNTILRGNNDVAGEFNRILGRRGRGSGYRNLIKSFVDGADIGGTSNIIGGSSTGGDNAFARGSSNAVSGDNAAAFGASNTVSGNRSLAIGTTNTVSGTDSFSGGSTNTVAGTRSGAIGILNSITGTDSLGVGNSLTISAGAGNFLAGLSNSTAASYSLASGASITIVSGADYSGGIGRSHTINDKYTFVSGRGAATRRYAEQLFSAGTLNNAGDMQAGSCLYGGSTTSATQTDLYLDYQESVPSERFDLKVASSATVRLTITATGPGTGADNSTVGSGFQTVSFEATGRLVRTSTGGSYSWFGPTTATAIDLGVAVSSFSGSGSVVTVNTTGEHGLNTGDQVVISGASVAGYNGTWTVTRSDRDTFTFSGSTTGAATGAFARPVRAWSVALSPSSTGLRVQVTGAASTSIKWLARCDFVEVVQ
jgi:hypothetical protein